MRANKRNSKGNSISETPNSSNGIRTRVVGILVGVYGGLMVGVATAWIGLVVQYETFSWSPGTATFWGFCALMVGIGFLATGVWFSIHPVVIKGTGPMDENEMNDPT